MGRRNACCAVGLLGIALLPAGCADTPTPIAPTPSTASTLSAPTVNLQEFSLTGYVTDTAYRPVGGVQAQVIGGPRDGTVAITDDRGHFSMPGTFTGTVTVRASTDGYKSTTNTYPSGGVPPPPPGPTHVQMSFRLEPLTPSPNIMGLYTLTLTADRSCTDLPEQARTRTYTATIVSTGLPFLFASRLRDARFLPVVPCPPGHQPCTYSQFHIGLAGDYAGIPINVVEQLDETAYLIVSAGVEGQFGPNGISAPLNGTLQYCPAEPVQLDIGFWDCPHSAACTSTNHHFALISR